MKQAAAFEALTAETLPSRLGGTEALTSRIGTDTAGWRVREVGDGNLNLVFIVEGAKGAAVVKQALPYVRLVGESWPLPLKRSFFEYHALTRQEARAAAASVPAIFHFDEAQALIVMEYLSPHIILRQALIEGRQLPKIAERSRPVHGPHAVPRLRPVDDGARAQGRPGAVRRQCRALRHHRKPGLHRPLLRGEAEPPHLAAARRHRRRTARRPRPQGRGAAPQAPLRRQRRNAAAWRSAHRLDHGHRRRDPRHRSGIRLLRADGLRRRHAARQFLDGLFLAAPATRRATTATACAPICSRSSSTPGRSSASEFSQLWRTERTGMLYDRRLFEDQRRRARRPSRRSTACCIRSGPTCWALPASRSTAASSASPTMPISRPSRTRTCAPPARRGRWSSAAISRSTARDIHGHRRGQRAGRDWLEKEIVS